MTVINTILTAFRNRVAYSRVKHELASMPLATAIDLGLFREDAGKTARKVVYG